MFKSKFILATIAMLVALPATATTLVTFDGGVLPHGVTLVGQGHIVNGSVAGQYAAPYVNGVLDTTDYLAVTGETVLNLSFPATSVSFTVGSVDNYNFTRIFDTNGEALFYQKFIGTGDRGPAGSHVFNYTAPLGSTIGHIQFGSKVGRADTPAMEIDNVLFGTVPEPASWALMFVGFGLTGTMIRRRSRSVAA